MYLSDLRVVLLRRWYLTMVGLLTTAGLCVLAAHSFPSTYEARANVVFLPPHSAVAETANPYLALGGLDTASGVVARAMSDSATSRELAAAGVGTYSVVPDLAAGGPVLLVTAGDTTPESTLTSLSTVLDRLPRVFVKLQTAADSPTRSLITLELITRDTKPTEVRKQLYRGLLLALAMGATATLLLAAFIDGLLMRRRRSSLSPDREPIHDVGAVPAPMPLSRRPAQGQQRELDPEAPRQRGVS